MKLGDFIWRQSHYVRPLYHAYWQELNRKLCARKPGVPCVSGPFVAEHISTIGRIIKLGNVLEIGFNLGHSAYMMLDLGHASRVTSIDIRETDDMVKCVQQIKEEFSNRFSFFHGDSNNHDHWLHLLRSDVFQTGFIDGSHDRSSVQEDIRLCKRLGCDHFIFDDMHEKTGPGVIPAIIEEGGLILIALVGCLGVFRLADGDIFHNKP